MKSSDFDDSGGRALHVLFHKLFFRDTTTVTIIVFHGCLASHYLSQRALRVRSYAPEPERPVVEGIENAITETDSVR
jgi:hypothetical protein